MGLSETQLQHMWRFLFLGEQQQLRYHVRQPLNWFSLNSSIAIPIKTFTTSSHICFKQNTGSFSTIEWMLQVVEQLENNAGGEKGGFRDFWCNTMKNSWLSEVKPWKEGGRQGEKFWGKLWGGLWRQAGGWLVAQLFVDHLFHCYLDFCIDHLLHNPDIRERQCARSWYASGGSSLAVENIQSCYLLS